MQINRFNDISNKEFISLLDAYINFLPGITDLMFYTAEFAVVKPFIEKAGINCGFITAFIAPSGYLKTTLAKLYYLWSDNIGEQFMQFSKLPKEKKISEKLNLLFGSNLLLDDLKKDSYSYYNGKQKHILDFVVREVTENFGKTNVIITGETLDNMGCYSLIDRLFPIRMNKLKARELSNLKIKLISLKPGFMAYASNKFTKSLKEKEGEVLKYISDYCIKSYNTEYIEYEYAVRTERYSAFISLTRELFHKYVTSDFNDNNFDNSLDIQLQKQIKVLQEKGNNERKPDYILTFYETVMKDADKYIKICDSKDEYNDCENSCFLNICNYKLYITTAALKKALYKKYRKSVSVRELTKELDDKEILCTEPNSRGRQKNYGGVKHYVIDLQALAYILNEYDIDLPKYLKVMIF